MEFTAKSGAKVTINVATLNSAFKLKAAIEKAALHHGIDVAKLIDSVSETGEVGLEDILPIVLAIDSDSGVLDACFECLEKSIYNGLKITKDVFEDESARADLYEVLFYCIKVNLSPFFRLLLSSSKTDLNLAKIGESLKSI